MMAFHPLASFCCESTPSMSATLSPVSCPTSSTNPSEAIWKTKVVPFVCRVDSCTATSSGPLGRVRTLSTPTDGRMIQGFVSVGAPRVLTAATGTLREIVSGRTISYFGKRGSSRSSCVVVGTRTRI